MKIKIIPPNGMLFDINISDINILCFCRLLTFLKVFVLFFLPLFHFFPKFIIKLNMSYIKICITGGSGFIGTSAMDWSISKYETKNL